MLIISDKISEVSAIIGNYYAEHNIEEEINYKDYQQHERELPLYVRIAQQLARHRRNKHDDQLQYAIEEKINRAPQLKTLAQQAIDGIFEKQNDKKRFLNLQVLSFQLHSMDRLADRFRYFLRYFNDLEAIVTAEWTIMKPFSFLSLSSPLSRLLRRVDKEIT